MSQDRFRVHARTIDHLGQGQIADCPTAVSELWKNAYDAYARNVALHIFAEPGPMAVITDDGHGMSHEEFVNRWLAIGTENKASATGLETPESDRNGIPPRPTQGQKGIGRLSVAHLGQVVLVITKRKRKKFVAALVDWRVFENPHLMLDDIIVPVEEFKGKKEFPAAFERMRTQLSENVVPIPPKKGEDDHAARKNRYERIVEAWSKLKEGSTKDSIYETALHLEQPTEEQLECWPVWSEDSEHGMALFVFNLHHELAVWVDDSLPHDDDEAKNVKDLLKQTLISFYDPYADDDLRNTFRYSAVIHPKNGNTTEKIAWDQVITHTDLESLEHLVDGFIDENGRFNGRIRAFGKDRGMVSIAPARKLPKHSAKGYLGPIGIVIGAFEPQIKLSTMPKEEHLLWSKRFEEYSGFLLFRDGLRVLPYGRPDSDLFEIDAQRGKNAGRYFWAHRRMFGRIAFSRLDNPNLLDKAGREGLRDNQARRELKLLIRVLLTELAHKHFGSDSEPRQQRREEVRERHEQEIREAGKRARKEVKRKIRNGTKPLFLLIKDISEAESRVAKLAAKSAFVEISDFEDTIDELRRRHRDLDLGIPPRLDVDDLQGYRAFRDQFAEALNSLERLAEQWRSAVERAKAADPAHQADKRNQKLRLQLELKLNEWQQRISENSNKVQQRWKERIQAFMAEQDEESSRILTSVRRKQIELAVAFERLSKSYDVTMTRSMEFAEGTLQTLALMFEKDIDVEQLLRFTSDELAKANENVAHVNALAQVGITSEIIGHEFHTLDNQIRASLARMPATVKATPGYEKVRTAYETLSQKLRFLTPLKLSGRTIREEIRGSEIEEYIRSIFDLQLAAAKITLISTDSFKKASFTDLRSRIYPVFVNLVNNAMYWVSTSVEKDRRIVFDRVVDSLIVADNGPGVDPDDTESIFDLFFSRRDQGQGVGLYLCRQNLAVGGHVIHYAAEKKHRVLSGANFVLRIRGLNND